MPQTIRIHNPTCQTEAATDAYLGEVKAMLTLSFKEQPMQKANPYTIIGKMEVKLAEMKKAAAAREASTFKRLEHEAAVILARANIESIDLETGDLL